MGARKRPAKRNKKKRSRNKTIIYQRLVSKKVTMTLMIRMKILRT